MSGKIGKVLRIKYEDIDKADAWFDNKEIKLYFSVDLFLLLEV